MNGEATKTSASAVASLVLGIMSLLFFGFVAGIPAVICGHIGLGKMKRDPHLTGRGIAVAGLVTGYLGIAWSVVVVVALILLLVAGSGALPFIYTIF